MLLLVPLLSHVVIQQMTDDLTFQPYFIKKLRSFVDLFHDPIDLGCEVEKQSERKQSVSKDDMLNRLLVVGRSVNEAKAAKSGYRPRTL